MLILEKMAPRVITGANYITSVNGMIHPDRVMGDHDFLYILEGNWEVIENEVHYELHSDDLLILTAGRHHYGQRLCAPGDKHMYFHVVPTPLEEKENPGMEKVEDSVELQEAVRPGGLPDHGCCCHTLIHCENAPQIRRYFQDLIAAYWAADGEREDRLTLLFNLLLCELIKLQTGPAARRQTDSLVERIGQKVRSNPQMFYTAGEIAEEYFICPRTLNNRFHKACGKTFTAWQMALKLEMVRQFLIYQPDAKLHEAAVNFGFYDEFHLSKAFKKQYGQSPSRFRAEHSH